MIIPFDDLIIADLLIEVDLGRFKTRESLLRSRVEAEREANCFASRAAETG